MAPPSWAGSRLGLRLAEGRPPGGLCRWGPGGGLLFNDYAYSANEYVSPCASGVVVTRPRPGAPRRLPGCPRPVSARASCPAVLPRGAPWLVNCATRNYINSISAWGGEGGGCHCASSSRGFVGVPALWPALPAWPAAVIGRRSVPVYARGLRPVCIPSLVCVWALGDRPGRFGRKLFGLPVAAR